MLFVIMSGVASLILVPAYMLAEENDELIRLK